LLYPAFQLVGGGWTVIQAMLCTCLADVVPAEERATVFLQLTGAYMVAEIFAGPLAAFLMAVSAWLTLVIVLGLLVVTNLIILVLPETNEVHSQHRRQSEDLLGLQDSGAKDDSNLRKLWVQARDSLREVWDFILSNKRVGFLMMSIVFVVLGRFVQELLLQYATKRYGWSWSKAAFLLTVRSVSNLIILLTVVPALSWMCISYFSMSSMAKDLWLSRLSVVVQIAGSLLIAFAVNGSLLSVGLVVFAGGGGLIPLIRSLSNALVEEHHVGILNTLVGFVENVGLLLAAPLLSMSLAKGIYMGGVWIGLPFMCAAAMFSVTMAILWVFRLPGGNRRGIEEEP
jgi:hypothetical protein